MIGVMGVEGTVGNTDLYNNCPTEEKEKENG